MARVGSCSVCCTFIFGKSWVSMVPGSNSVTVCPRFICYPVTVLQVAVMKLCINNRCAPLQYLLDLEHKMPSETGSMLCMGVNSGLSH